MDAMSGIIAENLKRIRKENKWSLDTVSDMTGVSKKYVGADRTRRIQSDHFYIMEDCNGTSYLFYGSFGTV